MATDQKENLGTHILNNGESNIQLTVRSNDDDSCDLYPDQSSNWLNVESGSQSSRKIKVTIKFNDSKYTTSMTKPDDISTVHEFQKSETGKAITKRIQCIFDDEYTKKATDVNLDKLIARRNESKKKTDLKPTLYYEDEDAVDENAGKIAKDTFCKVRIIFPLEKTLAEFQDILR